MKTIMEFNERLEKVGINFMQTICAKHEYVEVKVTTSGTDTKSTSGEQTFYQCRFCGKLFQDREKS